MISDVLRAVFIVFLSISSVSSVLLMWRAEKRRDIISLIRWSTVWIVSILILHSFSALAEPVSPSAIRVIDGDTLELTTTGERIRLLGIDTPELRSYGRYDPPECERIMAAAAKRDAARLLGNAASVEIERHGQDRYRRTLARLELEAPGVGSADMGAVLVLMGVGRRWEPDSKGGWC